MDNKTFDAIFDIIVNEYQLAIWELENHIAEAKGTEFTTERPQPKQCETPHCDESEFDEVFALATHEFESIIEDLSKELSSLTANKDNLEDSDLQIKVNRKDLLAILRAVKPITTQKELNPILSNVMLTGSKTGTTLQATCLGISLSYNIDAEIKGQGRRLLSCKQLIESIKTSTAKELVIEKINSTIFVFNAIIRSENSMTTIEGECPEKFPDMEDLMRHNDDNAIFIYSDSLQTLIKHSLFATTKEKTRYELDAIQVEMEGINLKFVGTDGKRLAIAYAKTDSGVSNFTLSDFSPITIPVNTLAILDNLLSLPKKTHMVKVAFDPHRVSFSTDQFTLVTRLSEGRFPPYEKVIPSTYEHAASLPVNELLNAVKQINAVVDQKDPKMVIRFLENKVSIETENGETHINIPCEYQDKPIDMKFNPEFFIDALSSIKEKEICARGKSQKGLTYTTFKFTDANTPITLQGEGYQYIILPIKPATK